MKFGLQSYPETDLTTKVSIYKTLTGFDNIILLPYAIGKIKMIGINIRSFLFILVQV